MTGTEVGLIAALVGLIGANIGGFIGARNKVDRVDFDAYKQSARDNCTQCRAGFVEQGAITRAEIKAGFDEIKNALAKAYDEDKDLSHRLSILEGKHARNDGRNE